MQNFQSIKLALFVSQVGIKKCEMFKIKLILYNMRDDSIQYLSMIKDYQ